MTLLRTNLRALAGSALVCALVSGCAHKPNGPALPQQARTPNIYVPPPNPENLPPMEAQPPADVTDAKPVVAEEVKPKKRPKKQPPAPAPVTAPATTAAVGVPVAPPVEAAPVIAPAPAETATLGALGSGGDANPRDQKDVLDKLSAVEKRLTDLPSAIHDKEQKQIAKVRLFSKEASDALKGGDVDGARILATKAELLLDDLTK